MPSWAHRSEIHMRKGPFQPSFGFWLFTFAAAVLAMPLQGVWVLSSWLLALVWFVALNNTRNKR